MAILSYLAVASLAIDAARGYNSVDLSGSSHLALSQRKSTGFLHLDRRDGLASEGIKIDAGFWYADFTVGGAYDLSLLIDTGSGDIVVNPGIYIPGKISENLNIAFENTYGTTSKDGTGSATIVGDLYSDEVSFGGLSAVQIVGSANGSSPLEKSGIAGFSGQRFSQLPAISECRFGLALSDDGTGTQILGELDTSLYTGNLVVAPIIENWVVPGDLVVGGEVQERDMPIELDSGTATIVGPILAVSAIFNATGIQGVLRSTSEGDLLTGYFPCDKSPTVGFNFPSKTNASIATEESLSTISKSSSTFNIPLNAWAAVNNGNNNCTAVLSGQDYKAHPGLWVVGQPFFQGLYVDHDMENGTVGFAPLKGDNPGNTTAPTASTPTPTSDAIIHRQSAWAILLLTLTLAVVAILLDALEDR
ncbi:hypothetical protein V493_00881 [Pseudogymnoascus sp. VKM F-4281 (FW-2241)]|nr:hypothetical protein V493_00881 [Pseudogymnoascus sp. VKM F-4281 (FW-2241)]